MTTELSYREVFSLVLEKLGENHQDQFNTIASLVIHALEEKGMVPPEQTGSGVQTIRDPQKRHAFIRRVREQVRQAMWECLSKGLLVFGMNEDNPNWPWYRLTDRGAEVAASREPQPYDPDRLIAFFRANTGKVDGVVVDYLVEAVQTFNTGCYQSAAVMLGCASEKIILLLVDALEQAITDPSKKKAILQRRQQAMVDTSQVHRSQGPTRSDDFSENA